MVDEAASKKASQSLADFWRLAFIFESAESRKAANDTFRKNYPNEFRRIKQDPEAVKALRWIGARYAELRGWEEESRDGN